MAGRSGPKIVTDGLVFCIDPVNSKSLPNPRHLNSFDFDGTDDNIEIGTDSSLHFTGSFTLAAWVNPTNFAAFRTVLFRSEDAGGGYDGYVFEVTTAGKPRVLIDGGPVNGQTTSTETITAGEWSHIVATHDNSTNSKIYINGVESSYDSTSSRAPNSAPNAPAVIGAGLGSGWTGRDFLGQIGKVSWWNAELSAAEVTELYNSRNPFDPRNHSKSANLVSYYPLGDGDTWDGSNWTVNDLVGGNTVTSSNMAAVDLTGSLWAQTNLTSMIQNNITGSMKGGVHYTSSALGALHFNGTDDYINIDKLLTDQLATTTTGTWEMWYKPDLGLAAEYKYPMSFGDTNDNNFIQVIHNTNGTLSIAARTSALVYWNYVTDDVVFADNTWIHIALVQNGTSPVMYVNGIIPSFTKSSDGAPTGWFNDLSAFLDNGLIGALNKNNGGLEGLMAGTLGQVNIYTRALTSAEVLSNYNAIKGRYQ